MSDSKLKPTKETTKKNKKERKIGLRKSFKVLKKGVGENI